ncbi:MAG: tRNA 2-thiouridine(34) synthase MnmA [Pseudomonadales bacterium]|nr:tRNA 2-thiouridine(34) synthase MnmA [Pseudomonadales bacterium]
MKIIVGMSGGVDSSVSAYLLKEQGHSVEGLFMKNWDEDDGTEYCTAMRDLEDAQAVCDRLSIPLHTINFAAEYWDRVFEHFLAEYRAGRTPNPDILCNREIKFRAFLDYARMLGADQIATGHYARHRIDAQGAHLYKGLDASKDQSYFLHAVHAEALAQACFPLGELQKTEVRAIATRLNLSTAQKKDSTGICFIGERRFTDFLRRYLPAQPGVMETAEGREVGQHQGLMFYTEGQRQGLLLGGQRDAREAPWYVLRKDLTRNALIVGQGDDHPGLYSQRLWADHIHWIQQPALPISLQVKIRYRQADQNGLLRLDGERFIVEFDQPQRAISPGQSVVFYRQDECLGGGVIAAREEPML